MVCQSVTKSNALIDAGYRLSLTEIQVILYGISLINPINNTFPRSYKIEIARFAEMFDREHTKIYHDLKEAILKKFWERDFSYRDANGKIITNRWLTQVIHEDKTGYIEIKFSEEVEPYLHNLKGNYTTYYIEQIAKMRSIYSIRFYEISIMRLRKSQKNKYVYTLTIEDLKHRLMLHEKYKRFCDFKTRVLDKAKKEINKHSDIRFAYEIIKQGRTPNKIKFTVSYKCKQKKNDYQMLDKHDIALTPAIIEEAKNIMLENNSRLDLYNIIDEFKSFAKKNGTPNNISGAFIGFVKKKVAITA